MNRQRIMPVFALVAAVWAGTRAEAQCNPVLRGQISFDGALNSAITDIAAGDGVIFIAERYGVIAVSVADPAHPVMVGSLYSIPQVTALELRGERLYVANSAGFSVWNVSNPANMVVMGSSFTGGNGKSLSVMGTKVDLLTYPPAFSFVWPFSIWNMEIPASPVMLGEFFSLSGGIPQDVVSTAGYAYVATKPQPPSTVGGLRVVDTDPAAAAGVVTAVQGSYECVGMVGSYLLASSGVTITVFDVTSPTQPTPVTTVTTPQGIAKIVVDMPLVFAGGGIFDFAAPRAPVSMGTGPRVLEARDGRMYEGFGSGRPFTLRVYDTGCDRDGDGLLDSWEIDGVPYVDGSGQLRRYVLDVDGDGVSDANELQKDVFVEVDAMAGRAPTGATLQHVIDAFRSPGKVLVPPVDGLAGGLPNVNLHIRTDAADLGLVLTHGGDYVAGVSGFQDFQTDKAAYFGTPAERNDAHWPSMREAKRLAYRYCIFANSFKDAGGGTTNSGIAEGIPSDDFMVTLGSAPTPGGTPAQQAGTFMHELGHALGLKHGGGDAMNWKPNYYSIMNYWWQTPNSWQGGAWGLRYSEAALPTLDENALRESNGLGAGLSGVSVPYRHVGAAMCQGVRCFSGTPICFNMASMQSGAAVDWNGDCVTPTLGAVAADINNFSDRLPASSSASEKALHGLGRTKLEGHHDWVRLKYNFRTAATFAPGAPADDIGCAYDRAIMDFLGGLGGSCEVDLTADGVVDFGDYLEFLNLYEASDPRVDFNGDGVIDFGDYLEFLNLFDAGC